MPRLRFNPAGFAPPPDTNLVFTRHEQFRFSADLLLIVQEENGLVVVYLFGLHILILQDKNGLVVVYLFGLHILILQDKNGLAVVYRCWIHAIGNPRMAL